MLSAGMLTDFASAMIVRSRGILIGIAAAGARRDRQLLDDAGEDLAALGVSGTLLVLDGVPFGMAGHGKNPRELTEKNDGWMLPRSTVAQDAA